MFSSIARSLMKPPALLELKEEIGRSRGDSAAVLHEFTRACDPVCKQRFHNNFLYFILADKEKHKRKSQGRSREYSIAKALLENLFHVLESVKSL